MKMENKVENKVQISQKITRRKFIGVAAGTTAAFTIVPRYVLGGSGHTPPSEKLNVAGVGVGGMGAINIDNIAGIARDKDGNIISQHEGENIVALCDVDDDYAGKVYDRYPNAKVYHDFRKMLDKQKDIDAVIVATPDHTHAVIAMAAMKRGKHVYVQKPLTRTIYEARMLTEAARKYKVVTQMGNQGHSGDGVRDICEWIWADVIGEVKEVHAWTNRPVWPQGIDRPKDTPDVPPTLNWDLWVGPAPMRPYHPAYLPRLWRGWWDFGCGALGDMACHVLDPVFWALKLRYPSSVEAYAPMHIHMVPGEKWGQAEVSKETFPLASIVRFEFPAREGMPAVKVNWYDGGLKPPRPQELEEGRPLNQANSNVLFMGTKGVLRCGEYGDKPQLIPYSRMRKFVKNKPPQTLERIKTSHEVNWVEACKTRGQATSGFDYAGPFTETVLVGNLALKRLGNRLLWDGENMKFTNDDQANAFVKPEYRQGWSL